MIAMNLQRAGLYSPTDSTHVLHCSKQEITLLLIGLRSAKKIMNNSAASFNSSDVASANAGLDKLIETIQGVL